LRKFVYKCAQQALEYEVELEAMVPDIKTDLLSNLHYAFIVPTHWDTKIRDEIFRPIFVQANLIEDDDNLDKLQFFTELECTLHYMREPDYLSQMSKELVKDRLYLMLNFLNSSCSYTIFEVKRALFTSNRTECLSTKVVHTEPISKLITLADVRSNIAAIIEEKILKANKNSIGVIKKLVDHYVKDLEVKRKRKNA
jgi:hypothetical protein